MGKKKPFIDKKNASVFHVVRRSQRDVGTEATAETLSDFVLMPSPANNSDNKAMAATRQERSVADAESSDKSSTDHNNDGKKKRKTKKVDFQTLKSQIAAAGLLDTTAKTYSRYTKPIDRSGGGAYYVPSADIATANLDDELLTDTSKNALDVALEEAMAVHEVGRMLDSIALTPDCMDEDMAGALFGEFEEGQFEEILDDFCLTANKEELDEDDVCGVIDGDADQGGASGAGGEFNFEQHIQMLMERARAQESGRDAAGGRELDDDFFRGVTPLHGRVDEEENDDDDEFDYERYDEQEEDDDDYDNHDDDEEDEDDSLDREYSGKIYTEEQLTLCQKFEEALLEYDSDDVGNLDEECDDIVGDRPLEGDLQFEAALDEFLTEKEDEILIEGTGRRKNVRTGGSGYSALVGTTMVNAGDLDKVDPNNTNSLLINIEESKRQMMKDLAEADAILANPEMDLPPEEILIDGKSYFSVTSRSMWDCESILSTYSNLDNNPAIIGRSRKGKKKKSKQKKLDGNSDVIPEDGPVKIQLSAKTGLPLGVFGNSRVQSPEEEGEEEDYYGDGDDTFLSINRGEARKKDESKMEKKERKFSIKEERKICRMQKKMLKEAFKEEFQKRGHEAVVDSLAGAAVFHL